MCQDFKLRSVDKEFEAAVEQVEVSGVVSLEWFLHCKLTATGQCREKNAGLSERVRKTNGEEAQDRGLAAVWLASAQPRQMIRVRETEVAQMRLEETSKYRY